MRLLYFYQYFGTPAGGWSTRVYEMCRRWVKQGHQVTVITSPYDKSDIPKFKGISKKFNYDGIDVIVINFAQSNKHHKLRRIYTFAMFSLISIFYAFKLKCDGVIASSGPITAAIPGLFAKWFRGKKMIFEVRDLWPEGGIQLGMIKSKWLINFSYWLEKICYKNAALVVACSKGMKDSIVERFPQTNCIVVPNACDVELFTTPQPFQMPQAFANKKIICYTGSLGAMDNCMQIFEGAKALAAMHYNKAHLVIIGEGVDKKPLEEEAKKLALNNITFLGLMPKTQVIGWLQQATAALVCFKDIPVLNSSSPNKMFDAFATGLPIVQTTNGWIKELIDEKNCGINVPANNGEAMAKAIIELCENGKVRNEKAANAHALAKTIFSRDFCAQHMLEEMQKVVPQK